MSNEATTFRVIDERQNVHEARVREPALGKTWREVEIEGHTYEVNPDYSPRASVAFVAAQFTPWQGVQVLAPGEATREEIQAELATVRGELDAARTSASEYLAALYKFAVLCDVCCDHLATRRALSNICDCADCGDVLECVKCQEWSPIPRCGEEPSCYACGHKDLRRVPRTTTPCDLPHAPALRAANAAHRRTKSPPDSPQGP